MAFVACSPVHTSGLRGSTFHEGNRLALKRIPCRRRRCIWLASTDQSDVVASKSSEDETFVSLGADILQGSYESSNTDEEPQLENSSVERRGHIRTTLAWVGVSAVLTPILGATRGWDRAFEFVTAYVVEYSLSVDNLFVFLLIFNYFKVPRGSQGRVLQWGIIGAFLLRGTMIVAGQALTERFEFVTLGFAGLLLFSAVKLLFGAEDNEDEDLSNNGIVKFARSLVRVTNSFDGDRFFSVKNGMKIATPLFLVLLCVELSDVVFALDSVPAVLGISDDVAVIYLSNILAIQGLRSLFFVLSDTIGDLRFLSQALAIVLAFVGGKMIAGVVGYEVPILPSLGIIVTTLMAGVGFSVAFPKPGEAS